MSQQQQSNNAGSTSQVISGTINTGSSNPSQPLKVSGTTTSTVGGWTLNNSTIRLSMNEQSSFGSAYVFRTQEDAIVVDDGILHALESLTEFDIGGQVWSSKMFSPEEIEDIHDALVEVLELLPDEDEVEAAEVLGELGGPRARAAGFLASRQSTLKHLETLTRESYRIQINHIS